MPNTIETFRKLHESGCFVLPNPWDAGSAVYLHHLGFKALASTSSGFAFSHGLPDDIRAVPRDAVLQHFREIVAATPLPVNADFQNGHADEPERVAENVTLCVATGVAGLSIEDSRPGESKGLYDFELALERVKAARRAIDDSGVPVVLTARCEAWLVGDSDPFATSIKRLTAFADAGADCLYAPGVTDTSQIDAIVKAVAPKPVNVLVHRAEPNLTLAKLTALGVRRISVGSALARVAWGAFIRAAKEIASEGTFGAFGDAASGVELNDLFRSRQ
ncbi:MAG TPA: isocitrate lyase/phosphoenolpyruvate mutase family protein [Pyrinomonadaceae bacterium]|nr:isocitrate lyase/phosphoenolpyruvate mutase family protein [Pyrinomonadaceae bacterium]